MQSLHDRMKAFNQFYNDGHCDNINYDLLTLANDMADHIERIESLLQEKHSKEPDTGCYYV